MIRFGIQNMGLFSSILEMKLILKYSLRTRYLFHLLTCLHNEKFFFQSISNFIIRKFRSKVYSWFANFIYTLATIYYNSYFKGFIWEAAVKFHALVVFGEHRFYGKSMPFGNLSFTVCIIYFYHLYF